MKVWFFGPDDREELRDIGDNIAEVYVLPVRGPLVRQNYLLKIHRLYHTVDVTELGRQDPRNWIRERYPAAVTHDNGQPFELVAARDALRVTERWYYYEFAS